MPPEPWLYAAVAVSGVIYAAVVIHFRRVWARDAGAETPPSTRRIDRTTSAVECPTCGTANEPGYRFCRDCVSELPGAPTHRRPRAPPAGRRLF